MRQRENSLGHSQGSCSEWIQTVLLQCEWKLFLFLPHAFFVLALTHAHTDHSESLTPAALTPACFLAPSLCFHTPHFTLDHLKPCPPYLKSTLMFKAEEQGRREEKEEIKCKRGLMRWWWWWGGEEWRRMNEADRREEES